MVDVMKIQKSKYITLCRFVEMLYSRTNYIFLVYYFEIFLFFSKGMFQIKYILKSMKLFDNRRKHVNTIIVKSIIVKVSIKKLWVNAF